MAEKTAASADELRAWLNTFAASGTPWTYTDVHGKAYKVLLVELVEKTPGLDRGNDEATIELVMVEV